MTDDHESTTEEGSAEENGQTNHKKPTTRRPKKTGRDDVQLFAQHFGNSQEEGVGDRDGGRPKRKLKEISRFDPESYDVQTTCKTGEGFPCPRCSFVCSYDSRSCTSCLLPCYYEAGQGVVTLKERNDMNASPRTQSKDSARKTKSKKTAITKAMSRAKTKQPTLASKLPRSTSCDTTRSSIEGVVVLFQQRQFVIKDYPTIAEARKATKASRETVLDKITYNLEHAQPKKRKGKFSKYDFRDASDVRTGHRWQCEILAVQHADFHECSNLAEAREHLTWPIHLADAHYRMQMGKKVLNFMRRKRGDCVTPQQGTGAIGEAMLAHAAFAHDTTRHFSDEKDTASKETEPDHYDKDQAVEELISPTMRGKIPPSVSDSLSDEVVGLDDSDAFGNSFATGHLAENDLGHFGKDLSDEHDMFHQLDEEDNMFHRLNEDCPDVNDVLTENGDTIAKLQETVQTLVEEKKDLQLELDSLLANPTKEEKDLQELTHRLSAVSTERDNLAKEKEDTATIFLERDELRQKLEEVETALKAREKDIEDLTNPDVKDALTENGEAIAKLQDTVETLLEEKKDLQLKLDSLLANPTKEEKHLQELTHKLSAVSTERDNLAKEKEDMATIFLERDELRQKLEEVKTALETREKGIEDLTNPDVNDVLTENGKAIVNLQDTVETLLEEKKDLHLKLDSLLANPTKEEKHLQELTHRLSAVSTERDNLAKEKEDMATIFLERDELRQKLEDVKTALKAREKDIEDLTNHSLAASEERATIVEKLRNATADIMVVKEKIEHVGNPIATGKNGPLSSIQQTKRIANCLGKRTLGEDSKKISLEIAVEDLQDQAKVLNKTVTHFGSGVAALNAQVLALATERDVLKTKSQEDAAKLSQLQSMLEKVHAERDIAEARVQELLNGKSHTREITEALNLDKEVLVAKIEECIARLYENDSDADELLASTRTGESPIENPLKSSFDMNSSLPRVEKLEQQLRKLTRDKHKLEAYTKQTLHIFQQKYYATSQDYKARLKEKTTRIQALEAELNNNLEEGEIEEHTTSYKH